MESWTDMHPIYFCLKYPCSAYVKAFFILVYCAITRHSSDTCIWNPFDGNLIPLLSMTIRTNHDWPSQMHENLLFSRVKTRAIASPLTPLINKFECICEGHAWLGLYYIMIIIKISKRRILIGRIFHFHRCQILIWRNEMEPFDRAWFGCCHSGRIPSDDSLSIQNFNLEGADDYEIPMCNSNDVMRSAVGLTQVASRWKQMRTHAPKQRECLPFKITWAQISSRNARCIFSLHMGAVVWPLLPDRDTFRDLGFSWLRFSWSDGRVKINH